MTRRHRSATAVMKTPKTTLASHTLDSAQIGRHDISAGAFHADYFPFIFTDSQVWDDSIGEPLALAAL